MCKEIIIVKIQVGSHLYGTSTAQSDVDYKGVFLPSRTSILLGKIPKSYTCSTGNDMAKNTAQDVDVELYSLHYFIQLACEGQTVALDMLHAPDMMIVERSEIWDALVKERHRFYTKNLHSFVRYARRQASKYGIKGARLHAINTVLDVLKAEDSSLKLQAVWDRLPRMEYCSDAGDDPHGIPQYQVCEKLFQASASIGYVIPILEKFSREYGSRAHLAADNANIDWKAMSHALRVAFQVKEILISSTITFPLREAAFLRQVKEGKRDYVTEVAPTLDSVIDEVESLIAGSQLPEHVDTSYWEQFLCETLEHKVFGL